MAQGESNATRLDALWLRLDETARARIDAKVMEELGVLGRRAGAEGSRMALRRVMLQKLLDEQQ